MNEELWPPELSVSNPNPSSFPDEFKKYFSEVMPIFPNIPYEAFEEWIFPFWYDHISLLYGNLDFKKLNFFIDEWPTSKFSLVKCYKKFNRTENLEKNWDIEFFYKTYGFNKKVVSYWKDLGTWFKPPWVLDSESFSSGMIHRDVERPFMLIEGHTRLGALRLHEKYNLASGFHKVWVVSNKFKLS